MAEKCEIEPSLICSKCSTPHFFRFDLIFHEKFCGVKSRKKCPDSKKTFKNKESLKEHVIKDHLLTEQKYDEFKCPIEYCSFLGFSFENLRSHISNSHINDNTENMTIILPEIKCEPNIRKAFQNSRQTDKFVKKEIFESQDNVYRRKTFISPNETGETYDKNEMSKRLKKLLRNENGQKRNIMKCDICSFTHKVPLNFRKG